MKQNHRCHVVETAESFEPIKLFVFRKKKHQSDSKIKIRQCKYQNTPQTPNASSRFANPSPPRACGLCHRSSTLPHAFATPNRAFEEAFSFFYSIPSRMYACKVDVRVLGAKQKNKKEAKLANPRSSAMLIDFREKRETKKRNRRKEIVGHDLSRRLYEG